MIKIADLVPWTAARERPSPNFNARASSVIEGIMFHHTGGSDEGAESWMQKSRGKRAVSCHLHFRRDASTTRMVDDHQRAWHAGSGTWRRRGDLNSRLLGWEIGNMGNGIEAYTDLQYAELAHVSAHYIRQGLERDDFISHDEVDGIVGGGRKNDPLGFDWDRWWRETSARLNGQPVVEPFPWRVHSPFSGEDLIVTRYINDAEWYYLPASALRGLREQRAMTPLSKMPPAKGTA